MEAETGFLFLASKITADGDCSQEIKRHLLLERKALTNLGSVLACLGLVHGDDPEGCCGEGRGRGFIFGNACTPVVNSCQCMAKPIQYCKVK